MGRPPLNQLEEGSLSDSQGGGAGGSQYDPNQYSGNLPYDRSGKRYRRTANEIERRFQCWCGKAYGSEGSLNQHKKLKNHMNPPPHLMHMMSMHHGMQN